MGYTKTARKLTQEEKERLALLRGKALIFLSDLLKNNATYEEIRYSVDYMLTKVHEDCAPSFKNVDVLKVVEEAIERISKVQRY